MTTEEVVIGLQQIYDDEFNRLDGNDRATILTAIEHMQNQAAWLADARKTEEKAIAFMESYTDSSFEVDGIEDMRSEVKPVHMLDWNINRLRMQIITLQFARWRQHPVDFPERKREIVVWLEGELPVRYVDAAGLQQLLAEGWVIDRISASMSYDVLAWLKQKE